MYNPNETINIYYSICIWRLISCRDEKRNRKRWNKRTASLASVRVCVCVCRSFVIFYVADCEKESGNWLLSTQLHTLHTHITVSCTYAVSTVIMVFAINRSTEARNKTPDKSTLIRLFSGRQAQRLIQRII